MEKTKYGQYRQIKNTFYFILTILYLSSDAKRKLQQGPMKCWKKIL